MNAAGTRLYSSELVANTLTVYDTTDALSPVEIQHLPLNATDGPVLNLALDPTEEFLYALAGHGIHIFNVDSAGMLTETPNPAVLPMPEEDSPFGLAVVRK